MMTRLRYTTILVLSLMLGLYPPHPGYGAPASDTAAPKVTYARTDGKGTVLLFFSEFLDKTSEPDLTDFQIKVDGPSASSSYGRAVQGAYDVAFHDDIVVAVHFYFPIIHGDKLTISYRPGANPIRDRAGNNAPPLVDLPVVNKEQPDSTPPTLGEPEIEFVHPYDIVIRASEALRPIEFPPGSFEIRMNDRVFTNARPVGHSLREHMTHLRINLLERVYFEDVVSVSYIGSAASLQDLTGNSTPLELKNVRVRNRAPERDTIPPRLNDAWAVGDHLYLDYNEWMLGKPLPSGSNYSVRVNNVVQPAPVVVDVLDRLVTLVLAAPLPEGAWVTLSYTPGPNPTRDVEGNEAKPEPAQPIRHFPAPETSIISGPTGTVAAGPVEFTFAGDSDNTDFLCSLDLFAYEPCSSPVVYSDLGDWPHSFRVRAGRKHSGELVFDPTPAERRWTVGIPAPAETPVATATPTPTATATATPTAPPAATPTPAPPRDTTPPLVSAPEVRLVAPGAAGSASVPVQVTWSPATDSDAGVARHELQESSDGGRHYRDVTLAQPLALRTPRTLPVGERSYRYRLRAVDHAGNVSPWRPSPRSGLAAYQDADRVLDYVGAWKTDRDARFYGGAVRYGGAGARASFRFTGRGVSWVSTMGRNRGRAVIYLDGVKLSTVDLYSTRFGPRRTVFATAVDPNVPHVLSVRVLRAKNAASHGRRIDIDAFVTMR